MIVSHDRYFLNRVCNGILALEGNGEVYVSEGNYDYYLEKRAKHKQTIQNEINSSREVKSDTKRELNIKQKKKKLSFNDAKELEAIEEKIMLAEFEVERIENIFSAPDFYQTYAAQTNELNKQLDEAKLKVKLLYDRWDELEKKKNELNNE